MGKEKGEGTRPGKVMRAAAKDWIFMGEQRFLDDL